jgi:EAL domain-containing protein (putative c-di-GMP-specific phosphodiesterase class I)
MYDISLDTVSQNRLLLETDLRLALATDELLLYYQPIMDLRSRKIAKAEALIRWHHPTHGLLTPDAFLPLADDIGIMREIDSWVLQQAIAQAARWQANGHPLCVTINLTAHSLQDPGLVEEVTDLLQRYSFPPHQVTIELTEHIGLRDLALTRQVLTWLRKLGLHIALDDFGNGYASLTYLQQMPFDVLKIDRSFTRGIRHETRDEAVARALLALGHGMGLQVLFEGVENEQQLAWLCEAGCTWAQGYFIGRPLPAERISST